MYEGTLQEDNSLRKVTTVLTKATRLLLYILALRQVVLGVWERDCAVVILRFSLMDVQHTLMHREAIHLGNKSGLLVYVSLCTLR